MVDIDIEMDDMVTYFFKKPVIDFKYKRGKRPRIYYRFLINKEKKTLFLQYYKQKIVIKCHEEDDFNWKIGLGLALSNANAINERKAKWHRDKWFRTKENHKLDYEAYSNWVLVEYYKNDMEDLYNLEQRVNNAKDKEFINI